MAIKATQAQINELVRRGGVVGPCNPGWVHIVEVPMPPTTNNLFLNVTGRGRVPSPEYRKWRNAVEPLFAQMAAVTSYPVEVCMVIRPGKGWRKNSDVANREKAITDAMVQAGVLVDDSCEYVAGVRIGIDRDYGGTGQRGIVTVWCEPWKEWWR